MAAINEAYRVLGDSGRRVSYDRDLRASTDLDPAPESSSAADAADVAQTAIAPLPAAKMPWKLMIWTAVGGSALVLIGAAFVDPPADEVPDGILRSGSCVQIEPNGDAREIRCTGVDDVVVELLIPIDARCPADTEPHRDRLGLGTACIAS